MGKLLGILKGPISDTLASVDGILGKFIADPKEKLAAQLELAKIEAELQEKVMSADVEWAKTQADVIKAETTSESVLARTWRPALMYVCITLIAYDFLLSPMFALRSIPMPDQLWQILHVGIGGYIGARTAEKIVPQVAEVFKKK